MTIDMNDDLWSCTVPKPAKQYRTGRPALHTVHTGWLYPCFNLFLSCCRLVFHVSWWPL